MGAEVEQADAWARGCEGKAGGCVGAAVEQVVAWGRGCRGRAGGMGAKVEQAGGSSWKWPTAY